MVIERNALQDVQGSVRHLKGLYVQRLADGILLSVAVEEGATQYSLAPSEYRKRHIVPPLDELPDFTAYVNGLSALKGWQGA